MVCFLSSLSSLTHSHSRNTGYPTSCSTISNHPSHPPQVTPLYAQQSATHGMFSLLPSLFSHSLNTGYPLLLIPCQFARRISRLLVTFYGSGGAGDRWRCKWKWNDVMMIKCIVRWTYGVKGRGEGRRGRRPNHGQTLQVALSFVCCHYHQALWLRHASVVLHSVWHKRREEKRWWSHIISFIKPYIIFRLHHTLYILFHITIITIRPYLAKSIKEKECG